MDWKSLLAYITGSVDQHLLLRNEYLVTENRMLRRQLKARVRLSDGARKALAELGQKLGKQALEEVATIVKPDTILAWHRRLVAQKFNGSTQRKAPGRPPIDPGLEALVVRLGRENRSWGYDRIVGALANLGYTVSDQTVGNILKRHGIPPVPERKTTTTWREFIRCACLIHRRCRSVEARMTGFGGRRSGMERQTLDKLEAAFEAVEHDLSKRVAELAVKSTAGRLSQEETAEYEQIVRLNELLSILKLQAEEYWAPHIAP